MSLIGRELELEKKNLEFTKEIVSKKLEKLKKDNEELNEGITNEQKDMWSNMAGMDIAEIEFANSLMESSVLQAKYFYQNLLKFERVLKSPYFGRIDFEDNSGKNKIYIGLSSVSDEKYNNYVYDWRAPISSLYYDYELGKAMYKAPDGIIKGHIDLKRQYKIEDSELLYAFDSDVSIQDEMLQEVLSNNASSKMKDIVTTIQKEQNAVIRNTDVDNLIVEGAAGSGKTSVALHRIAFILYRYRDFVNNKNIVIFSPNKVFSDYISDVLPSLGEDNVNTILFPQLIDANITDEYELVENYQDLIERFHNTDNEVEKRILEIKMGNDFIDVVDNYLKRIVNGISFSDIIVDGELLMSKEECLEDFNYTYKRYKPLIRVYKIINNVVNKYKNTHLKKYPKYTQIIKNSIRYNDNIFVLMKNMYNDVNFLKEIELNYGFPMDAFQKFSLKELKGKDFKYYDAIIYLYIKSKLIGIDYRNDIKYVVVDEAQDYNLMQFYLMREYYKQAKFTILGDPNQAITTMVNYDKMDRIEEVIGGKTKLLKLLTTYRSSYEITDFCNNILNLNHVNMVNRHSDKVQVINVNTENLGEILNKFIDDAVVKGFASISILCENKSEQIFLKTLIFDYDIKIYVLPVYEAKGLEFDSVLVYDSGFSRSDKKLYYVACSRALHELNILNLV